MVAAGVLPVTETDFLSSSPPVAARLKVEPGWDDPVLAELEASPPVAVPAVYSVTVVVADLY